MFFYNFRNCGRHQYTFLRYWTLLTGSIEGYMQTRMSLLLTTGQPAQDKLGRQRRLPLYVSHGGRLSAEPCWGGVIFRCRHSCHVDALLTVHAPFHLIPKGNAGMNVTARWPYISGFWWALQLVHTHIHNKLLIYISFSSLTGGVKLTAWCSEPQCLILRSLMTRRAYVKEWAVQWFTADPGTYFIS